MSNWNDLVSAAKAAVIPAPGLRAVTLAQWALESAYGQSALSRDHFNFAGLKYRPEMAGYATPVTYQAHDGPDTYCKFANHAAFIRGYWQFISRSPYRGWDQFANDPAGYVAFLKSKGYAQDPNYVSKVLGLLDEAIALLTTPRDEEDRPSRSQLPKSPLELFEESELPVFVTRPEVTHTYQGTRPSGLEGAIVHYDAGRTTPNSDVGAISTLQHAESQGYAYATVSTTGKILLPRNHDWNKWGYHAGKSRCPITNRDSVSQFYVGFEVNCPGWIYPTDDGDKFVPWFNAVRKPNGEVILDREGHATIEKPNGPVYRRNQLRHVPQQKNNIAPGFYVPYTEAQFKALVNVLLFLRAKYPQTFQIAKVLGHDEVSPGRKVDPGGSLGISPNQGPMTMKEFRAELLRRWADITERD